MLERQNTPESRCAFGKDYVFKGSSCKVKVFASKLVNIQSRLGQALNHGLDKVTVEKLIRSRDSERNYIVTSEKEVYAFEPNSHSYKIRLPENFDPLTEEVNHIEIYDGHHLFHMKDGSIKSKVPESMRSLGGSPVVQSIDNKYFVTQNGKIYRQADDMFDDPKEIKLQSIWGHLKDNDTITGEYACGPPG